MTYEIESDIEHEQTLRYLYEKGNQEFLLQVAESPKHNWELMDKMGIDKNKCHQLYVKALNRYLISPSIPSRITEKGEFYLELLEEMVSN